MNALPRGYFADIGCWEQITPDFIRGDTNSDGKIDLSDVTTILGYLYQSQPEVWCHSALDVDDSATPGIEFEQRGIDLTDAIYLLSWLFEGGLPPHPPFPGLGPDPNLDSYGCEQKQPNPVARECQ